LVLVPSRQSTSGASDYQVRNSRTLHKGTACGASGLACPALHCDPSCPFAHTTSVLHHAGLAERAVAILKIRGAAEVTAEAKVLLKLGKHPRLLRYIGMVADGLEAQMIVTEYAPRGSLKDALESIEDDLSWTHQIVILRQICSGMEALTGAGLVHRDLALRNVLLFNFSPTEAAQTSVKIADFGLPVNMYGAVQTNSIGWGETMPPYGN